jgi:ankyrin repeat protein
MLSEIFKKYARHAEFVGDELVDVNQPGMFGSQMLHLAAFKNDCADISVLLDAGANLNACGDLNLSALHYAVLGDSTDAMKLLLQKGIDKTLENEFGETAFEMARVLGNTDVEELINELNLSPLSSFDRNELAKSRWIDFRSIQEGNFWAE